MKSSNSDIVSHAAAILEQLRHEGDPTIREDLGRRYGIHTQDAVGLTMARMKAIAKPLWPNHELAVELWESGVYEARTIAAHIDAPERVDVAQMNAWCADFDNWALVDTACFVLFDKAPDAWSMIEPWANSETEFTKRAGFALLWALALHDKTADDSQFRVALQLVPQNASDPRHLVGTAQTMALRAISLKRPNLRPTIEAIVQQLSESEDPLQRRVARPILRLFATL